MVSEESKGQRQPRINPTSGRLSIKPRRNKRREKDSGPLYWFGPFDRCDGYGDVARSSTLAVSKIANIRIQSKKIFHHHIRDSLKLGHLLHESEQAHGPQFSIQAIGSIRPPMGTKNAVFTMWEASILDPAWVRTVNQYDLVIVPCDEVADVFRKQVSTPVVTVPQGLDHSLYYPSKRPTRTTTRFGTAGNLRHGRERKGVDRAIEWFLEAFPSNPNVSLSVKLNDCDDAIRDDDPRIEIIRGNLTHTHIADWLRSLDCYVDASSYEGWGMWPFHAMATSLPVIGTYFGGHREYFSFRNHLPIGYRIEPAEGFYSKYGVWAMPIASEGVAAMRWIVDHPQEAREIGRKAQNHVQTFTWERFAREILEALEEYEIYQT